MTSRKTVPLNPLHRGGGGAEIGRIVDLQEQQRGEVTRAGHHGVERSALGRHPFGSIDALGSERFLEGGADRVPVLEDQREAVAKTHPARSLQLADAMSLISAHTLVFRAGAHVEIELDRAFRGHQHLQQPVAERGRLWHVGVLTGPPV